MRIETKVIGSDYGLTMQRRSKKRVALRQERTEVWVNPDIRKLLSPYRVAVDYPEMRSTGIAKAILRAHLNAPAAEKQ